jgi:hypothetical protein
MHGRFHLAALFVGNAEVCSSCAVNIRIVRDFRFASGRIFVAQVIAFDLITISKPSQT